MRQRSNLIILFGIAFLLVGGAIVYLIVNDGDDNTSTASGSSGGDRISVLVASEDIPANTVATDAIEQGLLETKEVAAGSQPAGAVSSPNSLENRIFAVQVKKGATISDSQLATRSLSNIKVPDGFDGVAISVPYTSGGAGYIAPGDRVNVYGVYGEAGAAGLGVGEGGAITPRTELALTNVTVLDVSAQQATSVQAATPTEDGSAQTADRSGTTITYLLALTPTDVERVVQLSQFADVYLTLVADGSAPAADTPGSDGTSVNAPVSADSVRAID